MEPHDCPRWDPNGGFCETCDQMGNPPRADYERIALAMTDTFGGDVSYYAHVLNEPGESVCEACERSDWEDSKKPGRPGLRFYGTPCFTDRELTDPDYQMGGDISLCEDCLADSIIGTYRGDAWSDGTSVEWYVR